MSVSLGRRAMIQRIAVVSAAVMLDACASTPSVRTVSVSRIGYLFGGSTTANSEPYFRERLRELGHVEGRDIMFETRAAANLNNRLPAILSELIGLPVDVLVTQETPATLAAKQATTTIPIVFIRVQDPVGQGIVASFPRPGGNITGAAGYYAGKKGLELLQASAPGLKRIAVLLNANNPQVGRLSRDALEAARVLGLELEPFSLHTSEELDTALATIAQSRPDALWVGSSFTIARDDAQIPEFAVRQRLPAMYGADTPFVRAGGMLSVGSSFPTQARRAAELVDKILKGARPGDLPVEQPTEVDVILNLSAAQRVGLTIPESVLRQVTEFVH